MLVIITPALYNLNMQNLISCSLKSFQTSKNYFLFLSIFISVAILANGFFIQKTSAEDIPPAYTEVSGDILENTHWTLPYSPYVVTSDIYIPDDVTLTIDPGVVVKFDYGTNLIVDGKLEALGMETNLIYFTSLYDDTVGGDTDGGYEYCYYNTDEEGSNIEPAICEHYNDDPQNGDWGLILIRSKTSKSTLNNVINRYSRDGIYIYEGGSVDSTNLNIDQDVFFYKSLGNSFTGLKAKSVEISMSSSASIINSTISNMEGDAVLIYSDSSVDIKDSNINGYNGIEVYQNSSINVIDSSVECENDGIAVFVNSSLNISGGDINCGNHGVYVFSDSIADITGVKISGASEAGLMAHSNLESDGIKITKSEITENENGFLVWGGDIVANENSIHDNTSTGVTTYDSDQFTLSTYNFTNNFWGNATGPIHSLLSSGQTGDILDFDNVLYEPFLTSDPLIEKTGLSSVLFLPGFEGSRLYKPDYNGGTTNLWEPNGNTEEVQNLLMNPDGTATREDIYTKDVIDNAYLPVIGNIYKSFISQLYSMKNTDHIINDYSVTPYDWRLSLEDILNNGDKTDDGKIYYSGILGQTATPYIIKELKRMASTSKTGKVTIIAHSNGGLVTKALINKLGDEASVLIDNIIFVGVPQAGTPQAVGGMLHGFDQALPKDYLSFLGISKLVIRELGQNMPSSYNLLPSSPYFTYVDDPVITFDNSEMLTPWRSKYGAVIHSSETMHSFLTDQSRTMMPTSKAIYSPPVLNEPLLNKAESLHGIIDNWVPPSGVKLTEIAGWGEDTLKTIEYYQGIKSNCNFPIIASFCSTSPVLEYRPKTVLDGDGTVLTPSALWTPESNNVKRYWLDLLAYNSSGILGSTINRSHAGILEVPQLRDFIKNIITNDTDSLPEFILTSAPQNPNPESRLHFILHSPLSLDLYDDQGNHTGISESTNIPEENIPGSSYKTFGEVKYISVPNSNKLHLSMNGYESGSFTLDIEETKGDTIINTTSFAAVPTSPDTIVTLDIPKDGGIADLSPLSVDGNGDGVSDLTLISQIGEIVIPDFTPPEPKISIDPTTKDLRVESNEADTTISKNSNTYTLTDKSGNITKLFFQKTFLGKSLTLAKLTGIQYNSDKKITLPYTSFIYLWNILKNPQTLISQTIVVDRTYVIEAVYDIKKNKTTVYLKKKGATIQKQIFTGLHVSKLTLNKGIVGYEL